jgi:hypothetical protein
MQQRQLLLSRKRATSQLAPFCLEKPTDLIALIIGIIEVLVIARHLGEYHRRSRRQG